MKRLLEIQRRLKAPKNQRNNFGKYNYRSAEDILEAVKPLLAEQGLLLVLNDDVVKIGDRYYIKATATITDGAEFQVTNTAFARESETKTGMDASQITGTASSYARKYCLNGLLWTYQQREHLCILISIVWLKISLAYLPRSKKLWSIVGLCPESIRRGFCKFLACSGPYFFKRSFEIWLRIMRSAQGDEFIVIL